MEEEDDDFYDPADAVPTQSQPPQQTPSNGKQQETESEEVEVEEDDDVCGYCQLHSRR